MGEEGHARVVLPIPLVLLLWGFKPRRSAWVQKSACVSRREFVGMVRVTM